MHLKVLPIWIFALLACACSRNSSGPVDATLEAPIHLRVGESAKVAGGPVTVRVAGVNDSRCPSDVVCVTAGDAAILLALSGAGAARTDTVYLVRQPRSTAYGAFRFDATDVQPAPRSLGPAPSNQTVTLTVAAR